MTAPFLWIILPIFFSILFLFFRKYYLLVCLFQISVCILIVFSGINSQLGFQASTSGGSLLKIEPEMNILGRSLIITPGLKTTLLLFYGFLGFWTIGLYILKIKTNIAPLGLTFIGLLIAALAVEPFLYSALIIEIAVIISVLMLSRDQTVGIEGISRLLVYFTIGMPFILLAGWYLAGGEITPVNDEQLIQATVLLGLGFVLWLAVFPFHTWVLLLSDESNPYEGLLILILLPIAVVVLLLKYINGFAWLRGYEMVFQTLRLLGILMISMGSIWFPFQKNLKKATGYLLIVSTGVMITAIGLNSINGYILTSYLILMRIIGFSLLSWTLTILKIKTDSTDIEALAGLFNHELILAISIFASLFTIVGMPLLGGFPVLQALYSDLYSFEPRFSSLVIICITILSITILNWILTSLKSEYNAELLPTNISSNVFLLTCVILLFILGVFPNQIYPRISGIIDGFQFLIK